MKGLTLCSFLLSAAMVSLAQLSGECSYQCPVFELPEQLTYVGGNLFDSQSGEIPCSCNATTGSVYLYRPGDASYAHKYVGYWNYSAADPLLVTPNPGVFGYGFRVAIVPDQHSPSKERLVSPTFTIISQEWLDGSYSQIDIVAPDPYYPDTWDSVGQQMIAWQSEDSNFPGFTILLYNSADVSWGPLVLAELKNVGANSLDELYFTYPHPIPLSPNYYQFVFVTSATATDQVLAISGPITIVDHPVATNTFPYDYTGISTIHSSPTGK